MMSDPKPKLLIVEDDAGLQAQLKWAYDDYEVLIAGDFDSAIELLRADAARNAAILSIVLLASAWGLWWFVRHD